MIIINNDFWTKVKKKTSVDKESIINLAKKLQGDKMKDEGTIREVIDSLLTLTGKEISDEKKDKIVNKIVTDKVPNNVDKMF